MKAPSCLFILTHVYVHICDLSGISINSFPSFQRIVLNTPKSSALSSLNFSFVEACMLKLCE